MLDVNVREIPTADYQRLTGAGHLPPHGVPLFGPRHHELDALAVMGAGESAVDATQQGLGTRPACYVVRLYGVTTGGTSSLTPAFRVRGRDFIWTHLQAVPSGDNVFTGQITLFDLGRHDIASAEWQIGALSSDDVAYPIARPFRLVRGSRIDVSVTNTGADTEDVRVMLWGYEEVPELRFDFAAILAERDRGRDVGAP